MKIKRIFTSFGLGLGLFIGCGKGNLQSDMMDSKLKKDSEPETRAENYSFLYAAGELCGFSRYAYFAHQRKNSNGWLDKHKSYKNKLEKHIETYLPELNKVKDIQLCYYLRPEYNKHGWTVADNLFYKNNERNDILFRAIEDSFGKVCVDIFLLGEGIGYLLYMVDNYQANSENKERDTKNVNGIANFRNSILGIISAYGILDIYRKPELRLLYLKSPVECLVQELIEPLFSINIDLCLEIRETIESKLSTPVEDDKCVLSNVMRTPRYARYISQMKKNL